MLVGTSVNRIDGLEKVTGSAKYTMDLQLPRMLHGSAGSPYAGRSSAARRKCAR